MTRPGDSVPKRPWELATKVPIAERGIPDAHKMPATPMIISRDDDDRLIADCYDFETAEFIVLSANVFDASMALCRAISDGTVRVKDQSGITAAFLRAMSP